MLRLPGGCNPPGAGGTAQDSLILMECRIA